jgi:hypothetical protein
MKDFINSYVGPVVGFSLFIFFLPTIMLGGVSFSIYLAGHLPEMGICQKVKK